MTSRKRLFASAGLAALMASSGTLANVDFAEWDITGEGYIYLSEWDTALGARNIFEKLDENRNGHFEFEEAFRENVFVYDVMAGKNGDGRIVMAEFVLNTFNRLDRNGDTAIDADEFKVFADRAASSWLFERAGLSAR